jgi:hypothetical protein
VDWYIFGNQGSILRSSNKLQVMRKLKGICTLVEGFGCYISFIAGMRLVLVKQEVTTLVAMAQDSDSLVGI